MTDFDPMYSTTSPCTLKDEEKLQSNPRPGGETRPGAASRRPLRGSGPTRAGGPTSESPEAARERVSVSPEAARSRVSEGCERDDYIKWLKNLYKRLEVLHCCDHTSALCKKIKSDIKKKIKDFRDSGGASQSFTAIQEQPPYLLEPKSSFHPKPSSFYPSRETVLQDAGRVIKDLIFSRAQEAKDWTLCFEDKTKGELVVGYYPGADRQIQIEKVEASLRDANLLIPPLRVKPFRATRGNKIPPCDVSKACTTDRCFEHRPIVGGLGIKISGPTLGTIGIVMPYKGKNGFFTAGHVVGKTEKIPTEKIPVYQFNLNKPKQLIGFSTHVSDYNSGSSDSAFVQLLPDIEKIERTVLKNKKNKLITIEDDFAVEVNMEVCMEGTTLNQTREGTIVATDATIKFGDGSRLKNQCLATYKSSNGDSGSPVYTKEDPFSLIGLNVGCIDEITPDTIDETEEKLTLEQTESFSIISKWKNVRITLKPLNAESPLLDEALESYNKASARSRRRSNRNKS